jgi:hypothetical protein
MLSWHEIKTTDQFKLVFLIYNLGFYYCAIVMYVY